MIKKLIMLLSVGWIINISYSQHIFRAVLKDSTTMELLAGVTASIKGTTNGSSSNTNGQLTINNIPGGEQTIVFTSIGYKPMEQKFIFPLTTDTIIIYLADEAQKMNEVIVEGTRSNRSIDNIPTRVEILTEEIDEATSMDPSKVSHLLTHSTGIQVQQTSATSNTANVRMQGLDGRYTQILKDGFPLYGGFSGSLSIMQIPPLDLRQVEYIKGSASTLYGGGAISGLINLISKDPTKEEVLLHINGSHIGAFDVNAFVSRKIKRIGFTILAQRNYQAAFDADGDGFTDMPELTKYNFNPTLFIYFNDKTKLSIGGTFTNEVRQGGDTRLLNGSSPDTIHFYKERNNVNRITTQTKFEHKFNKVHSLTIRNSFNIFQRSLEIIPSKTLIDYKFAGKQLSSFSEVAYSFKKPNHIVIAGVNFYSDNFWEDSLQSSILRNEGYKTIGLFANYTVDIGKMISMEAGFRGDYVFDQRFYALPRLSVLFKWTKKLTTRIGGGMGYRNQSIFNQEAELLGYRNVLPINKQTTQAEQSYGGNVDIGYKTSIGEKCFINLNQMFFYTYLDKPLVFSDTGSSSGVFHYANANGYTQSIGTETFLKFGFFDFVLFVGYTYTNVTNHFNGSTTEFTLTPQHSLKGDLLYSITGKLRAGLDYEFKSSQLLTNGYRTPAYWTFGAVVEYTWRNFSFYANIENYTNIRQTKYQSLISSPNGTPQLTEVWAPLDGVVFNGGVKIRL